MKKHSFDLVDVLENLCWGSGFLAIAMFVGISFALAYCSGNICDTHTTKCYETHYDLQPGDDVWGCYKTSNGGGNGNYIQGFCMSEGEDCYSCLCRPPLENMTEGAPCSCR